MRRLSIHGHNGRFSGLPSCNTGRSVDRKINRHAPLRKQLIVGESGLQRRIHDGQTVIVVQFQALPVEAHHDKVVLLLIVIQTDTDWSNEKGIFFDILLLKGYFF